MDDDEIFCSCEDCVPRVHKPPPESLPKNECIISSGDPVARRRLAIQEWRKKRSHLAITDAKEKLLQSSERTIENPVIDGKTKKNLQRLKTKLTSAENKSDSHGTEGKSSKPATIATDSPVLKENTKDLKSCTVTRLNRQKSRNNDENPKSTEAPNLSERSKSKSERVRVESRPFFKGIHGSREPGRKRKLEIEEGEIEEEEEGEYDKAEADRFDEGDGSEQLDIVGVPWATRFDERVAAQPMFDPAWSDERFYDCLLVKMIDFDLALEFGMNNTKLIIFSSLELPEKQWRLNRKYYMWGVFIGHLESSVLQIGDAECSHKEKHSCETSRERFKFT
ncbi:hypothetical protein Nepgr_026964 [Nepenthes gracilis]|uniref:AIPP2-like SPOC-like domain-containing protein n=1 Tax=Nepenthes gracilis TaxID=150966 RepID=A0AAD3T9L7_NEPGR|nr:hypothetical protein Nepgr_026964 [Nepenthes gracilis]